jgi:hypothetical protein
VQITARDYAQTLGLLRLHGLDAIVVGRHAGASRTRKAAALAQRSVTLYACARKQGFDLGVAHGSNDLALAAAAAGIPAVNMFDYEFAIQQHHLGCRLARKVITPDAIPPSRLARFGATGDKLLQYPGQSPCTRRTAGASAESTSRSSAAAGCGRSVTLAHWSSRSARARSIGPGAIRRSSSTWSSPRSDDGHERETPRKRRSPGWDARRRNDGPAA